MNWKKRSNSTSLLATHHTEELVLMTKGKLTMHLRVVSSCMFCSCTIIILMKVSCVVVEQGRECEL